MYMEAVNSDMNYIKEDTKKLQKACEEFEALFMAKMFSSMRQTVGDGGLIKKNMGEKIFTEMMDQEIAKQSSEGRGMGLSKMLFDAMSKNLPAQDGNNFPEGKNGAAAGAQYRELQKQLNGTDVASKIDRTL